MQAAVSTAEAELKKSGVSYTDIEKAKIEAAAGFGAASAQISSGQSALNSAQTTLDSNKESLDSAQDQITEGWDSIADAKKQLADKLVEAESQRDLFSDSRFRRFSGESEFRRAARSV